MTFSELTTELRSMTTRDRNVCAEVNYWFYKEASYRLDQEKCEIRIWDDKLNNSFKGATPEEALTVYRKALNAETAHALGEIPVLATAE